MHLRRSLMHADVSAYPFYMQWTLSWLAAENIRDQALNIPDNFSISLFSIKLPLRFDIGNPARFTNIGNGPYARGDRKCQVPQALVVNSPIRADCNISLIQVRLSQLIPVADFSKAAYAIPLEELKRHSVISQIPRFIQGRSCAA